MPPWRYTIAKRILAQALIITLIVFVAVTTAAKAFDARRAPRHSESAAAAAIANFMNEASARRDPGPFSAQEAVLPALDLGLMAEALSPDAMAGIAATAARERAVAWARALSERQKATPTKALAALMPPSSWFQARLIMPRDEPTLRGDALTGGAYGLAYKDILTSLAPTRASAPQFEAALAELWETLELGKDLKLGPKPPVARGERWLPTDKALGSSHRYALDLFFTKVTRNGAEEKGPVVRSIAAGIVVAAADDWDGTDRPSQYRGGGLSPKAGNGLIIYAPHEGRYYAYFHLHDLKPGIGEVVEAGQALGHGGNSGVNARKKGHGEHLHIEIHESSGKVWTSQELKIFIARLR